ncbi:unnamed protein product [Gadus morhua 'NCC']
MAKWTEGSQQREAAIVEEQEIPIPRDSPIRVTGEPFEQYVPRIHIQTRHVPSTTPTLSFRNTHTREC